MNGYLLDTNICIFYLKGRYDLETKVEKAGWENCFISEITVAELKFGAASSDNPPKASLSSKDSLKKYRFYQYTVRSTCMPKRKPGCGKREILLTTSTY